jgi:hypothetical protein
MYEVTGLPGTLSYEETEVSEECGPGGSGQCDGYEDGAPCGCPCHEALEDSEFDPEPVRMMARAQGVDEYREAHAALWALAKAEGDVRLRKTVAW